MFTIRHSVLACHIGINYLQRHLHCWSEHDLSVLLGAVQFEGCCEETDLTSFPLITASVW